MRNNNRINIQNRDHNWFSSIDTEFKAYILGWIYADGSLQAPIGNRQGLFTISVQLSDGLEFIPKLAKEINGTFQVKHAPAIIKAGDQKQLRISVSSTKMFNDLVLLGLQPNKTENGMTFPLLEKEFERHFIRGFLDGDGSIIYSQTISTYQPKTKAKTNVLRDRGRIAFTSTDKLFLDVLASKLPITKTYYRSVTKRLTINTFWIERGTDIRNTINYLYTDSTNYLSRKYLKAMKIISSEALCKHKERSETT